MEYKDFRFQAMWGPDYDGVPSQDNGALAMQALQYMLMQYEGNKIYLLPVWPKGWLGNFKLHAPQNTIVTGTVKDGKIIELELGPRWRKKDIIIVDNI